MNVEVKKLEYFLNIRVFFLNKKKKSAEILSITKGY